MSSAVVFLLVTLGAVVVGSLVLWAAHRVRIVTPAEFQEQLRALAPRDGGAGVEQPSGIVRLEPGTEEER